MARISFQEFFRTHFGDVQVRLLYLTIPGSHLGSILVARESETGELFARARIASSIPGKGSAESLRTVDDVLRESCGPLYKNLLISLPWVRATQTDPIAFVPEFHAGFAGFSDVRQPNMDLAWMRATPGEYIDALLRTFGRDPNDIYHLPNPDRPEISQTDPARGLVLTAPTILPPRVDEVPALLVYSLASI